MLFLDSDNSLCLPSVQTFNDKTDNLQNYNIDDRNTSQNTENTLISTSPLSDIYDSNEDLIHFMQENNIHTISSNGT